MAGCIVGTALGFMVTSRTFWFGVGAATGAVVSGVALTSPR